VIEVIVKKPLCFGHSGSLKKGTPRYRLVENGAPIYIRIIHIHTHEYL